MSLKKIGSLLVFSFCFYASQAQDTTLKEYVGKYTFAAGSYIPSAEVTLTDTVLTIISAQGSSSLEKRGKDTFALTSYNGTAYFKRDAAGKVGGIKVSVEGILLEGPKDGSTAWIKQWGKEPENGLVGK